MARSTDLYFNPRTREGCDKREDFIYNNTVNISIHAPARGATIGGLAKVLKGGISIHAPARGATPRAKELRSIIAISIHAPARGATFFY